MSSLSVDPLAGFRLDGKVAVVTGASSGIGARAARVLDALGATVVVAARRTDKIKDLASSLQRGDAQTCDVGERGASAALIDGTVERHGRVDVVMANAGVWMPGLALRESLDSFAETLTIDLIAPFELVQAAGRHMREKGEGGSIITVGSNSVVYSTPVLPQASYVAAKTGLVGLTRELAVQWARYDIRVNAICPGAYPSEMTAELEVNEEARARIEAGIPMGRIARADELDGIIALFATRAGGFVTGQALVVDGGASLT
jgi:NAD(P)-dependent dehydrogenase (short-subunit alcohol dehydrogenase family)